MEEKLVVVKRFLCDYCKCIFVADRNSYGLVRFDEFEYGYECQCPRCRRIATQVIGTDVKKIPCKKRLKTIKDFKK